jgi:hypothetical protein
MVVPVRANVVYGIEKAPIKDWKARSHLDTMVLPGVVDEQEGD